MNLYVYVQPEIQKYTEWECATIKTIKAKAGDT